MHSLRRSITVIGKEQPGRDCSCSCPDNEQILWRRCTRQWNEETNSERQKIHATHGNIKWLKESMQVW